MERERTAYNFKKRKKKEEAIFEEKIAENFPNL